MRLVRLNLRGKVQSRGDAATLIKGPGDAVLIQRGVPRLLLISCPDGCGELFPINLDDRAGPAWRIYEDGKRGVTLYPSVWRESGCKSHYVIWRNEIYLFSTAADELAPPRLTAEDELLVNAVEQALSDRTFTSFEILAQKIGAIPWDVLFACRHLVRSRRAREGVHRQRGHFLKTKSE